MKVSKCLWLLLVATSIMLGCSQKKFETKEEFWEFLNTPENGYIQEKIINGIKFSMTYKPTDLLVDQELNEEFTKRTVDSLRNKYKKHLYFSLTMARNNQELLTGLAGNRSEFGAMVNQLAFGMGNKVHMVTPKKDTIAMADYVYPRMYGMSQNTSMLFVYPKEEKILKEQYVAFTIEDIGFNTGDVSFKIETNLINNQPELNF